MECEWTAGEKEEMAQWGRGKLTVLEKPTAPPEEKTTQGRMLLPVFHPKETKTYTPTYIRAVQNCSPLEIKSRRPIPSLRSGKRANLQCAVPATISSPVPNNPKVPPLSLISTLWSQSRRCSCVGTAALGSQIERSSTLLRHCRQTERCAIASATVWKLDIRCNGSGSRARARLLPEDFTLQPNCP